MARKKGEAVTLYCSHCTWGSEVALADTQESRVIPCAHCGKPIYWHRCDGCGMCYAGSATPRCPICSDDADSLRDD